MPAKRERPVRAQRARRGDDDPSGSRGSRESQDEREHDEQAIEEPGDPEESEEPEPEAEAMEEPEGTEESAVRKGADGMSVATAAQEGQRLIAAVTNRQPEGVTSVEPSDSGWVVEVEVLEDRHIPSSADVLALYQVELDADGGLVSYRRAERYSRGRGPSGTNGEGS